MGLNLTLKPGERMIINGAVIRGPLPPKPRHCKCGREIEQGGGVDILIENKSNVLLERDFMREEDATTPAKRLYFLGMVALLDGDSEPAHREAFVSWLGEVMKALRNPIAIAAAAELGEDFAKGNYHRVLKNCRHLIEYEDMALRGAIPTQEQIDAAAEAAAA